MIKINYFPIEDYDYIILCYFFRKNIYSQFHNGSFREDKNSFTTKKITKNNKDIIDICLKIFKIYGYKSETLRKENYFLELQRYDCSEKDDTKLFPFDFHEDDGAVIDYKVNTIVFYIEKSETIRGGDFMVEINGKKNTIPIEPKMALVFTGNLVHAPTQCYGKGTRDCMVFHLERK